MSEMHNLDIASDGTIHPRKGFKSFKGMVYQLWLINRRFKKKGVSGSFSVTLPLPEGTPFETRRVSDLYKFDTRKENT